jgi:hypothetical protein
MIIDAINHCLAYAGMKGWRKTYWAIDIHGTILKPTYEKGVLSTEFYPIAKEVLQTLTKDPKVSLILYTCSYPEEISDYLRFFRSHGIRFNYVNENPEINEGAYGYYDRKFYYNVLLDDKAGFDPERDWAGVNRVVGAGNR